MGTVWTRLAFDDLKRERRYLQRRNPSAARGFASAVKIAVKGIGEHPEMGRVHEELLPRGRYRYVLIERHQLIYRQLESGEFLILRLWDARRDPESLSLE